VSKTLSGPTVLRPFDRREVLFIGATAVVSSAFLRGCMTTTSDPTDLPDTISPITPNSQFYVQSCCGTPSVDPDTWTLSIRNLGEEVAVIDRAYLLSLSARDREHTLECIGTTPRFKNIGNAVWGGLPLDEVLAYLGVEPAAGAVEIHLAGADGYYSSIPVEDLVLPPWLVWQMNGEDLPADHGAPARLLVPGRYGTKNLKWLTELDFSATLELGFWEQQGWSNTAEYNANTLILSPDDEAVFEPGTIRLLGAAFAGRDPAERVEISTDGGEQWTEAAIDYAPGPDVWTLWHHDWTPPGAGDFTVQVRLITQGGDTSNPDPDGTDRYSGYDGSMQVAVTVV
jgi:DMSO/TMAO reductase YedYZ molybdopterin-dependent catalytic subunit